MGLEAPKGGAEDLNQKVSNEENNLKSAIDKAMADGIVTKAELQEIMSKYEAEKNDLTADTKKKLEDLYKEIGTKMLKDGLSVSKGDLDGVNKILKAVYGKGNLNIENSFPKGGDVGAKDDKFIITSKGEKGELTLYSSGGGGSVDVKLGTIDEDGKFNYDYGFFNRNARGNDDMAEIEKDRKIDIEKNQKPDDKKPEEKQEGGKPVEKVNLKKDLIDGEEIKWDVKGINGYTQRKYQKFVKAGELNNIDLSKIKNGDERTKIKKLLTEPSEDNVKELQTIIQAKHKNKDQIDGKFGPNTLKALKDYLNKKGEEEGVKAAAKKGEKPADKATDKKDGEKTEKPQDKPADKKDGDKAEGVKLKQEGEKPKQDGEKTEKPQDKPADKKDLDKAEGVKAEGPKN